MERDQANVSKEAMLQEASLQPQPVGAHFTLANRKSASGVGGNITPFWSDHGEWLPASSIVTQFLNCHEYSDPVCGAADRSSQAQLSDVVGEHAADIVEFRRRDSVLGLDDFDIVRNARLETLPRLPEVLLRDFAVLLSHFHLSGCRLQVEPGITDVAFDPAGRVFEFCAPLDERRVRLLNVPFNAATLQDWDAQ